MKSQRRIIFLVTCATIFLASFTGILLPSDTLQHVTSQFFPTPPSRTVIIKGIGVVGDSLSDEYQGDESRGFQYGPTTLNWIEQLVKSRKMDFGSWDAWGDVRRTGFAYNWSRSGASSESVLLNGQHVGLAQQIANGEVNVVIVYIGANDFSPANTRDGYIPIYTGTLSGNALSNKINRTVKNIETVVETIKKAGDVYIFLITLPDWNLSMPLQLAPLTSDGKSQVSEAIAKVNRRLVVFAAEQKITTIDSNIFYETQLARAPLGSIVIENETISLLVPGDDPHKAFLSDGAHPGTVLNGLFANYILSHMNKILDTHIVLLTDEEILHNAGL